MTENIEIKIKKLREDIERYNYFYYVKNESIVSDIEYDKKMKELEALEKEYPEYSNENSPSKNVGSSLKDTKFEKITHKRPMLSLSNSYNINDIEDFIKRVDKLIVQNTSEIKKIDYVLEVKLDGLSISVNYENGKLVQAVTRGDGIIGEDVTENVMQIASVPKYLKENVTIEVRGEIVLPISRFEDLNKKRMENGEEIFANPRNAASGTLRQIDPEIVKERGLDCYFYFITDSEKYGIKTHKEALLYIEKLGLKTTSIGEVVSSIKELEDRINFWENERKNLDYETDGLVIKLNEIEFWDILGNTTKSPRWAIAYKFPAKQVSTKLTGITWQVGRTGKVTPVAELEEVEVSGSRVKRASLHNFDEIERKDIRIGDRVIIEKAAEIIPQVVKSIKETRTGEEEVVVPPERCPICDSILEKEEGLVDLKCVNKHCLGKVQGRIEYFVSRDAMNIVGLGMKIIERFLDLGYINDITDIYSLYTHREEMKNLEKMGEKSVENLLNSIEESKKRDYTKTLYALGIPYVGKFLANLLAEKSKNIDNLMNMTEDDLLAIDGVGDKVAGSVYNFFRDSQNIETINKLKSYGINFSLLKESKVERNVFEGKNFLVTGKLEKFTRNGIKEEIEKFGGKNLSAVSKNLDYLIVGKDAGSKLKKAQEIDTIKILTEEEFFEMINEK